MKEKNNIISIEEFKQRRKERFCAEVLESIEKLEKLGYWQDSSVEKRNRGKGNIVSIEEGRK